MKTGFLYRGADNDWWWKVVKGKKFTNKTILNASTEGYERRAKCIGNYDSMIGLKKIPLYDEAGAQKRITTSKGKGY